MTPKCNLHTHTDFCDGKDTAEEMVIAAIEAGCRTLGFSGHSYLEFGVDWCMTEEGTREYIKEVKRLKRKYADKIEIALGTECDYFSKICANDYDYIIGSVHYVQKNGVNIPVDDTREKVVSYIKELYSGDALAYARVYYACFADLKDKTNCDIAGHLDLIVKFNANNSIFDEECTVYRKYALAVLDSLLERDVIIELNTGGISRGFRRDPYPAAFLLERIAEKKGRITITSDCHSKNNILYHFPQAVEFAKSAGIYTAEVIENGEFATIKI